MTGNMTGNGDYPGIGEQHDAPPAHVHLDNAGRWGQFMNFTMVPW